MNHALILKNTIHRFSQLDFSSSLNSTLSNNSFTFVYELVLYKMINYVSYPVTVKETKLMNTSKVIAIITKYLNSFSTVDKNYITLHSFLST